MSTELSHPISAFDEFTVTVAPVKYQKPTKSEELVARIPHTGVGTVMAPEGCVDDLFPAASMIPLGFFGFVPWLVGSVFIFSPNTVAKAFGITNLVFLIITVATLLVLLSTAELSQVMSIFRV